MPEPQTTKSTQLKPIPGITIKASDPDIKIDKASSANSTISTPENLSVAFRWQKKDSNGNVTSGVVTPLSAEKPNQKIEGTLEITRLKDGSHQVKTEKGTLCTVLLKKQDGEKVEVPINASINKPATEKSQTQETEKAEKFSIAAKPSIASRSFGNIVMPNKFGDILGKYNESLEAQAKKLNLPDSILERAKELNLTDLSKVESRISGNQRYYEVCQGNACIPLGQIEIKEKTPAPAAAPKIEELDLKNITTGANVKFTIGKDTYSIGFSSSQTTSVTDQRIGKLSKNPDGSLKLDVNPSYTGTITIGDQSKSIIGNSHSTNPTSNHQEGRVELNSNVKIPLTRGEPLRNAARIVANGISSILKIKGVTEMSDKDAQSYIQQNPDKNIVVIVTALQGCKYCDQYKPHISNIAANVPNSVFVVVPTPTTQQTTNFQESMYPSNFVYRAGRSSNSATVLQGTANADLLNKALGRP